MSDNMDGSRDSRQETNVTAEEGSWAAGRDIRDERQQFFISRPDLARPPRWDSPHLRDCPHCGRKWLSKLAMFCPTCGYSLQMARDRQSRERVFRWELTFVALPLLLIAFALTPSLEEVAADRSTATAVVYSIGNLLKVMSSVLAAATAWQWWRWWRGKNTAALG